MKCFERITMAALGLTALLIAGCASTGGAGGAGGVLGSWTFDDPDAGTAGWELASTEYYQYHGDIALSYDDATFAGNGMLRLDVDFTKDVAADWSEPKIKIDLPKSINMKGKTQWVFDFYYNPSLRTTGVFKTKVFSNNGFSVDSGNDIPEGTEDAGNGFVKTTGVILIVPGPGFMPDMRFSVVGSLTDYKGPVFFDNMRWE